MSKYGYSVYGYSKYGLTPKLAYSVEPMSINVIKFDEVFVSWQLPTGNFTRFRVVRNQNAYPETSEDGVIVYELNTLDGESIEGVLGKTSIYDGLENPTQIAIAPGRNIYYRVFLYTSDNIWVKAGEIGEIVPENTGASSKTINLLPRVLTSDVLSPLGVVDEASDLYQFLDGLAFSYEQMMTEIKLARPAHNLENSNYKTIPGEVLNVGLNPEPNLPMLRQRALIREAIALYADKGTALGVANYSEALTGFAPTVTTSSNLMLTIQDSTFYNSVGRWVSADATLSATEDMVPDNVDASIDLTYTLKIEPTDSGEMTLGADAPITQGVPIQPDTEYVYKANIKCPTSGFLSLTVTYYDKDGVETGTPASTTSSVGNAWEEINITETSPSDASYVVLSIAWDDTETYYVDMVYVGLSTAAGYEEARAVTVDLAPKFENYITNPSFEVDYSGWTLTNVMFAQSSDIPYVGYPGSFSGDFTALGSWSIEHDAAIPVEVGIYANVSQYIKSDDITSVDLVVELYDSEDTLLDTVTETKTVTNAWVRQHISVLIPSDSTASYIKYRLEGGPGEFFLDMVMAQDTYSPTDYFDGSMPELVGAIWESTENGSPSLYYPNKSTKILRLAQTLADWLPMNVWWRLTTPAGLEYTNLTV